MKKRQASAWPYGRLGDRNAPGQFLIHALEHFLIQQFKCLQRASCDLPLGCENANEPSWLPGATWAAQVVQERAELHRGSHSRMGEEPRASGTSLSSFPPSCLTCLSNPTAHPGNRPSPPHLLLTLCSKIAPLLFISREQEKE